MKQANLNEKVKNKKQKQTRKCKRNLFLMMILIFSITISAQKLHKVSYYSNKFNGKHTTSGQIYNSKKYTCAHRTYPFGTLLKIKNPKTGINVIVVVNDRGPHVKGIYLDLSYNAAKDLGIIKQGIMNVEVTVVDSIENNVVLINDTTKFLKGG